MCCACLIYEKTGTNTKTEAGNRINLMPGWVKHFSRLWPSGDQRCLSSEGPQGQVQNKYRTIQFDSLDKIIMFRKGSKVAYMDKFRKKNLQLNNHDSLPAPGCHLPPQVPRGTLEELFDKPFFSLSLYIFKKRGAKELKKILTMDFTLDFLQLFQVCYLLFRICFSFTWFAP